MNKVVVIGGGASGIMASYVAARNGADVILLEKNEKLGKKIFITGKGRCNVTNSCDADEFFSNIISNPKFLYSAYYGFSNDMLMDLIAPLCPLKTERGNRVFPQSDHSSDIIKALSRLVDDACVNVKLNTNVISINDHMVKTTKGNLAFDKLIIATGGLSYPTTGSTGDGYGFAKKIGHTLISPKPGLSGLLCEGEDCQLLQGLSLKNVSVTLKEDKESKKSLYEGFGEMLFTHFGISGPVILSASSYYALKCYNKKAYISIDLKSALTEKQLDERILRDFEKYMNKSFKNSLGDLLPSKMIPVVIKRSGIDPDKKVNEVRREERERLISVLKNFELTVTDSRPVEEAIITQGGVNVKEIDPSTMESKLCKDIYFAGEVLDIDALTGGFNLQIAFSTGYLAGLSAALSQ
ncbi:MAG: NAD(P)/FAD-dependent oxidoreductase [Lachnospiraceae bacterium]|nr:NAD(P)/FAD-dependent oxidoreductase [Lachnospiraceae bacterium]